MCPSVSRLGVLGLVLSALLCFSAPVSAQGTFIRGDSNGDGNVQILDAIISLTYLFLDGETTCLEALDVDDNADVNMADPIFLLTFLFSGGGPIPSPYPTCGDDPTPDSLLCLDSGMCGSSTPAPLTGPMSYAGPRMSTPRYGHTATLLGDGLVLIVGGTDERHLTALDAVEIFDESAVVPLGDPIPDSVSGDFIDQDIDGNLISLLGNGRFFHTANRLTDGRVVVIGGTTSILFGAANPLTIVFDPLVRRFTQPVAPNDEINVPRVRHTTLALSNGKLLVVGGQESLTVVIPIPGPVPQTQAAYPSTRDIEIFDPLTLSYSPALDSNGDIAVLTNSRGRAGHCDPRWAGFDNQLDTGDDIISFIGGYQTLSAFSSLAPQDLFPWTNLATTLSSMDFYSSSTGSVSLAQGLVLTHRVNDPIATNLGRDHNATPFGDLGMSNIVLVYGGDSNSSCPEGTSASSVGTTDHAELLVATYTGFGPASGVQFSRQTGATMVLPVTGQNSNTFAFGHEGVFAGCTEFNRSRTQGVLMDMVRTYDNQDFISSVVVTGGGIRSDAQFGFLPLDPR